MTYLKIAILVAIIYGLAVASDITLSNILSSKSTNVIDQLNFFRDTGDVGHYFKIAIFAQLVGILVFMKRKPFFFLPKNPPPKKSETK